VRLSDTAKDDGDEVYGPTRPIGARLSGAEKDASDEVYGPVRSSGLRLSDAEKIAAERGDGSLSQALAAVSGDDPSPRKGAERSVRVQNRDADGAASSSKTEGKAEPGPDAAAAVAATRAPSGVDFPPAPLPTRGSLDEGVDLSTRARAAAEALENLKRLLEREPRFPLPSAITTAPLPEPAPAPSFPEPAQFATAASAETIVLPPPMSPMPKRRLELSGFLAGFALSWAIGIVLYLFMTSG
jgi:hypothetical protein